MTSLAQLQRDFQSHVMRGDERIAAEIVGTARVSAATRLEVYSQAYKLRLIDALGSTFPRLQELLGKEQFSAVAGDYIDAHPSQFPSIRWFGEQLPPSLLEEFSGQAWLGELAGWEWCLASAFDAADAEPVGIEALAAVAPESWPGLSFEFHPSIRLLQLQTNAPQLFKALAEGLEPPEGIVEDTPQYWLIWRQQLKTQYRSLAADEAGALVAVRDGATFEMLCDTLCEWHEPDSVPMQAAGMLKRWVVDELIVGVKQSE